MDDEHSCKTINQKHDKEYDWVEGDDILQLGKKKGGDNEIDLEDEEVDYEVSAMTNRKNLPSKTTPTQGKAGLHSTAIDIDDTPMNGGMEGSIQTLPLTSTASDAGQSASGPTDGK